MFRTLLLTLATLQAHAAIYGLDDRYGAAARLSAAEEKLYSATQIVGCISAGRWHGGAGNLAGDFTHGVTVGHVFYDRAAKRIHAARECSMRVFDGQGREVDEVPFKRLVHFNPDRPGEVSTDLAMFELTRRPKYVERFFTLKREPVAVNASVLVVTYHFDVQPRFTKRKTRGHIFSTLGTSDERQLNIFHTDADMVPMSSGGPVYDIGDHLVALVQGGTSTGRSGPEAFDERLGFNRVIRLDPQFLKDFEAFVRG